MLAWVLLSILLMLYISTINIVHAEDMQSDFALEETATVLVEGGNFNTLKAGELIFADRTYTFADTAPEYLIGQKYLFQNLGGTTATVKTSGYVYILAEMGGNGQKNVIDKLTGDNGGFTQVATIPQNMLSIKLKDYDIAVLSKKVSAGEVISYEKWGLMIANFISSENAIYEMPLAQIETGSGTFKVAEVGRPLFADRPQNHLIADTAPEWFLGKNYLQSFNLAGDTSFTVKKDGWVYVLVETSNANGVNEKLSESYGFDIVGKIPAKTLGKKPSGESSLNKTINVYAKYVLSGSSYSFGSWGIVIAEPAVTEPLAIVEASQFNIMSAGEKLFSNKNYKLSDSFPEYLTGKPFVYSSLGAINVTVKNDGILYMLTETSGNSSQITALVDQGFTIVERTTISSDLKEVAIMSKSVKKGETVSCEKWALCVADYAINGNELATLTTHANERLGIVEVGAQIFSDRADKHFFAESVPNSFMGIPYVQGSIKSGAILTAKSSGYVYIITPTSDEDSKSQVDKLSAIGFTVYTTIREKLLTPTVTESLTVMVKYVSEGEVIEYEGWAITFANFEPCEESDQISLTPPYVIHNPTDSEYLDGNRNWQGIPGIAKSEENGRLWATWYSGGNGEGSYNWVVLYTSDDDGSSWTGPVMVLDHDYPVRCFDPNLWIDPNGRMWLIWSQSYMHSDGIYGTWMMYTDDPESANPTWSEPKRVANGIAMNDPIVLSSGEWLLPTAIWNSAPHVDTMDSERYSNVYCSKDEGVTWSYLGSVPSYEGGRNCDENMIIELSDGTLRMLIRTSGGIEESYSYDKGITWTDAINAGISNVVSRFYIATLASGNQILIYNDPPEKENIRSHMTVALSTDGGKTFPYKLIIDERLSTTYPDAIQDADGNIYVIYDHTRGVHGEIVMAKITEADIIAGKIVTKEAVLKKIINNNMSEDAKIVTSIIHPTCTEGGYTIYTCAKCGKKYNDNLTASIGHIFDDEFDVDCNVCGALDIKFVPKTSITLGSKLVYNVYVPAVDYLKSFTVDGNAYGDAKIVTLSDGNQYYHIAVSMPASEAARNVVLKATVTIDGKDYNETWTTSIPKYAKKIITDGSYIEKTLVKDVLAYIKAAYIYFDAENKTEVVNVIDEILGDYNNAFTKVDGTTDVEDGLLDVIIALEENPAVRFVLPLGVTADRYTFKSGNTTLEYTVGTITIGENTHYYAEVSLFAYQMINEITYTDGTNSGTWHINSYYDFVTTADELKNDANLVSLVEKLYNYSKSAEAYRASVTNK